jgi:hypothetical protein
MDESTPTTTNASSSTTSTRCSQEDRCAIHTLTAASIITPDLDKYTDSLPIPRRREYSQAGIYALQEAIHAHVKHAIYHMETDAWKAIRSVITPIIILFFGKILY